MKMSPNGVSTGNDNGYVPVETTDENCDATVTCKDETLESEDGSDADSDTAGLVVAPDGGWGWVVVIGSFLSNMIIDGITTGFGMFIGDIAQTFQVSIANVALIGSLLSGFYLIVGPFASALANRYGFRLVAIIGSILSALAFGLSYFANNVTYLCVVYGIIGGIGFGLIYVPSIITVGFYFEKWRALATGIAVCGSGIGTFLFAPLFSTLVTNLGWRYSILIEAVLIGFCAVFAIAYRPLKSTKIKELKDKEDIGKPELIMDSSKLPAITRMKMEAALASMRDLTYNTVSENTATIPRMLGVSNNAAYPNALSVFRNEKVYHTIHVAQHHRIIQIQDKRPSIPFTLTEESKDTDSTNGDAPLLTESNLSPVKMGSRRHTISEKRRLAGGDGLRNRTVVLSTKDINRPLYRDDIFFGASLTRLPQYTSQSSVAYNLSVVRPPTKAEIEEETKQECSFCPESIRRPLATMLDMSLLKSPCFLILAVSGFLTMLSFYIPFMFIKDRAVLNNMNGTSTLWLVAAIGISNTIGRIASGFISSLPNINVVLVNNICLTISGIATMLSDLWFTEIYQFLYCVIFGLTIACFASLRSVMVVELVGLERLTNAFGIILLFQGLGACLGTPIAGEFYTATGSYHYSFLLSGGLILVSAIMCYPLNMINRWEKRKLENTKEKSVAV